MEEEYDFVFKIIFVGTTDTGKTNLINKYINNEFSINIRPTVGVEFTSKNVNINGRKIEFQIWDTAGQERNKSVIEAFYKRTSGAFIVYDISNKKSFNEIDKFIDKIKEINSNKEIPFILIGNKSDLTEKEKSKLMKD